MMHYPNDDHKRNNKEMFCGELSIATDNAKAKLFVVLDLWPRVGK